MANDPTYTKPTTLVDLEERLAAEEEGRKPFESADAEPGRDFTGDGNDTSGYIGVDPMYQNYANETEKPGVPDEGAEAVIDERVAKHLEDMAAGPAAGPAIEEDDDPEDEENGSGGTADSGSTPTPSGGYSGV